MEIAFASLCKYPLTIKEFIDNQKVPEILLIVCGTRNSLLEKYFLSVVYLMAQKMKICRKTADLVTFTEGKSLMESFIFCAVNVYLMAVFN